MMEKINLDEGFAYGIGVFETMAVAHGKIIFKDRHLRRMQEGMRKLNIKKEDMGAYFSIGKDGDQMEHGIRKLMVSSQNVVTSVGQNPYKQEDYEKGFHLEISEIRRNETSPLTYIKTLNYGDNILEKQRARSFGYDEPVFLNSRGELAEGAVTNIFFCKEGTIYTPAVECGILPGIMREWIIEKFPVKEVKIFPEDISQFDEMFVTNSLLGIMPVVRLGAVKFSSRKCAEILYDHYKTVAELSDD